MTKWTKEQQKEHRKAWIEALRSGKYAQGQARLKSDKYCCLGVACDVSGQGRWSLNTYVCGDGLRSVDKSAISLPEDVKNYYGLRNKHGGFADDEDSLIRCNDTKKYTFEQIADIIEREPEGLLA